MTPQSLPLRLDVRDSRLPGLFETPAHLEIVANGFKFTEGPIWHPYEHHLRFSDIIGNSIYEWSAALGLRDIRPNSHLANGNTYDRSGRMLTCHHGTSRVTRTEPDGSIAVVASHYEGKQLNSPNDIVVRRDGAIYFTDPIFGRGETYGIPRERELPFAGVYRLDGETLALRLLVDDFANPNGLCFSLDEAHLYVNDTPRGHIRIFDMLPDGGLVNGRVWATLVGEGKGRPDGMKFDSSGMLFCVGPGGVHIFAPDATCLGVLLIPEHTANFAWGDADLRSLYITASTSVYRVRVTVPGLPLF
jgi:gluconolactonase